MGKADTERDQEVLSTRQAAARLGLALSTVQQMVESGLLPAWRTSGGHRRISAAAVEALRARQQSALAAPAARRFRVLVGEDEPVQRALYLSQLGAWDLGLDLELAEDGFAGLLAYGRSPPDLIITDLAMPGMDGFVLIRRLRALPPSLRATILVVSALSEAAIAAGGGLPPDIAVFPKPIPFGALRPLVSHLALAGSRP